MKSAMAPALAIALGLAALAPTPAPAQPPMGVTSDGATTTVRVWAPNAQSVAITGEFNGWKPSRGEMLVKDESTGIWSGTLNRSLPRGAYGFLINGNLVKRDPYGRAVTPSGDRSVFHDPASFDWTGDRAPTIGLEDLVIYEMHVGAFYDPKPADNVQGTFDDATRRLDHLSDLGINAVCLLPIAEFGGNHSWGYNPSDLFAVEQAYGGPDALRRFVKACHARGIAVHLDIVHNHYGPQNLDLLQFDGTGDATAGGIYFYDQSELDQTPWGPRPRFSEPMVRRFIRDNVMMWIDEFRVDGFRWDSTVNIRAYNFGANAIPEGSRMLEEINDEIRRRYPGKWSIAEDSYDIGNFHGSWDYDFHNLIAPALAKNNDADRDLIAISSALQRYGRMDRVIYVDNHDEAGKLNNQRRIASDADSAKPGSDHARRICGLGAVLTLTAPGIPLIFMGNEFQEYGEFHEDQPLDWSKTKLHAGTLALHKELIALRLNRGGSTGGLKGRGIEVPLEDSDRNLLVYHRWHERNAADRVVVAINLSAVPAEITIPFPLEGPWLLRIDTDWARFGGANRNEAAAPFRLPGDAPEQRQTLAPYSARIFSLVDRPAPAALVKQGRAAPPAGKKDRPPMSMYASVNLAGTFNDWDKTAWPLKLVEDYVWEGRFRFNGSVKPAFKLSANDTGVIFWGGYDGKIEPEAGLANVQVKRLGTNFTSAATWNGTYRFRFNEDLLFLEVEKLNDPAAPAAPTTPTAPSASRPPPVTNLKPIPIEAPTGGDDGFRVWTDQRGSRLEAKLVEATPLMVSLVRRDGKRVQIPLDRFSEADRTFVKSWLDENP